jgi:phospholipase C
MPSAVKPVVCAAAALLVAAVSPTFATPTPKPLRNIKHIVVVMMENRSFDHLFGWHPRANGTQEGLYADDSGVQHATHALAPDYQGCGKDDPDHSWEGGRVDLNFGKMDGFQLNGCVTDPNNSATQYCRKTPNDEFAVGYYVEQDRPFYSALARNYTTFDNFYSGILAETYPNRIWMHAAQTDRLENTFDIATLPTIWDRLAAAGVSARYYYSDVSFLWLWGFKYDSISDSYAQFLSDAASGNLPAVSFVEPRFVGEEEGVSGDDHPHADIRAGDAFLAQTFRAVANGPDWAKTVFIVTYDEWGGFFEHVAPPRAAAANGIDPDIVDGKTLLGMRIPVVVASPFTKGDPANPRVVSTVFDNTSILKMIESRFNLPPLTPRDASSDVGDLITALNLNKANVPVPKLPNPAPPEIVLCPSTASSSASSEPSMADLRLLRP